MADVLELILADHRRILRLTSVLNSTGMLPGEIGQDTTLASVWEWLARLLEVHMSAEDAICAVAFDASALNCQPDHEAIRAALRQAGTYPPGSAEWWRAVVAVSALCAGHFRREEQEALLALRAGTSPLLRRQLATQWREYVAAQA